jgi:ferric-dicitrate binding protein FerR (iron transport regulator)
VQKAASTRCTCTSIRWPRRPESRPCAIVSVHVVGGSANGAAMVQRIVGFGLMLGVALLPALAQAQAVVGCRVEALTNPPRDVLRCGAGLTLEAEKGTTYKVIDKDRDGRPESVEVSAGAVLVDVAPGRRGGFQVLTPHAIASVRGTLYVVDVKAEQSDVFVSGGKVGVRNRSTSESTTLSPGQGSDVIPGKPMDVHVWAAERVRRLMARFGR